MEMSIGPANLATSLHSFRNAGGPNQATTLKFLMPTLHSKQSGPMQKAETFDKFSIFKFRMVEDTLFVDKHLGTTLSCGMVANPPNILKYITYRVLICHSVNCRSAGQGIIQ